MCENPVLSGMCDDTLGYGVTIFGNEDDNRTGDKNVELSYTKCGVQTRWNVCKTQSFWRKLRQKKTPGLARDFAADEN